jgi:hypothetical protein
MGQTGPVWVVGTSGGGKEVRKGWERVNMGKYCVYKYENGKMRPVETISREDKEWWGSEFNYDILFDIL